MASEEQNYTASFKKEVAQKALDQSKKNVDKLSEEHDVPVSLILMWATELEKGGEEVFETSEQQEESSEVEERIDVAITDEEVANSVEHGVMDDKLNYKRLIFWSIFGIILVLIFARALFEMYQYNEQTLQERVSAESEFYEVTKMKNEARQDLDSFGVVDLENGIYRIPIDSAITQIAADYE
jgi:transposase-like protein